VNYWRVMPDWVWVNRATDSRTCELKVIDS
jgi:hypothetical protein